MSWNKLIGSRLDGGWTVTQKIEKGPSQTGGNFGICFLVERQSGNNTERAFMKAFDLERLLQRSGGDFSALQRDIESANFEIKLLTLCKESMLDSVVIALDNGTVTISGLNHGLPIQYLIFQLAEQDLRKFHSYTNEIDIVFNFSILRGIANGLRELHALQISHQDLKPSNILLFSSGTSKIADLGRSCMHGETVWHDQLIFAGDKTYAPPEVLYNYYIEDWHIRRFSQDIYMLGSLVFFLFCSTNLTTEILVHLNREFHPINWGDPYPAVLPYVRAAHRRAIESADGLRIDQKSERLSRNTFDMSQ